MGTFSGVLVVDLNGQIAYGAAGQVFSDTDGSASTPLDITDLNGIPVPGDTLVASAYGVLPDFMCAGRVVVHWVSGDFRIPLTAVDQIPAGGSAGQVLAKTSGSDYAAEWVDSTSHLPTGGTDGQVLTKDGSANGAVKWGNSSSGGGGLAEVNYTNVPAWSTFTLTASGGTYPARPSSRTDIIFRFRGSSPPTIGGTGAINGLDEWVNTTP